jgi:thiamine monophosphate kinase
MGPGENAGAVDVGGGLACAFKVESHNHPSAVEPFQGAATGVGGILRDIFAIGARPVAVLDSLRFGDPETSERSRYLLDHAVAGIGHYGNSIGVATVGGEVYFEGPYEHNCLVNAMALGLGPASRLMTSAAAGVGNVVVLFGASTGRDGIGGASVLASAELGGGDEDKRPTVQVGDPFAEKKLLECSLELLERGLLVSLQDLGAAGLTSSASEMASKGGVGIDLDVARVPLREADKLPEPLFTPSTKATEGHDANIDRTGGIALVGEERFDEIERISIELYRTAADYALERGIIIADTKFEFGVDEQDRIVIGDEVLTPDSSRYWPVEGYEVGKGQPSFDKQYVRDWASGSGWDKTPPAPELPEDVVAGTRDRYVDAYQRITGESFDEWTARTAP